MAKKKNKRKKKTHKKRNIIVLGMVLANKPTRMKDKNDYNRKQEKNVDEVDVFDFKGQHTFTSWQHSYVANSLPWSILYHGQTSDQAHFIKKF